MPKPRAFAFVCINQRDASHPRPSCAANGGAELFNALREEQGRRLATDVKVVAAGCLEACMVGPVVAVFFDRRSRTDTRSAEPGSAEFFDRRSRTDTRSAEPGSAEFPDDVVYGGVIPDDVPAVMDHLQGGPAVTALQIGDAEFDLRPPEMGG